MRTINDFMQAEEAKMTWWDRTLNNYPKVSTTQALALRASKVNTSVPVTITQSLSQKIIVFVIIFILGLFWVRLLAMLIRGMFPWLVILAGFLFISMLIYLVSFYTFLNKKTVYNIQLTISGLSAGDVSYCWEDIIETYIMSRWEGKRTNNYLLLHTKQDGFKKFNLVNFNVSSYKLSALIQHYKTLQVVNNK